MNDSIGDSIGAERHSGMHRYGEAIRRDAGLRVIEDCATEGDPASLIAAYLAVASEYGLTSGAGGAWTGFGAKRAYRFYFNTWPPDWLELYNKRLVFFDDPVVAEAQRRMAPFRWSELASERSLDEKAQGVLAMGYEYGWADGLVVPIHGPCGYQGIVSLASMTPLELCPADVSLLWVMSQAVHARCRTTPGWGMTSSPPPTLSAREAECMGWVAAGKTDWEIGLLMSISASTVHFHVERVKKRLATSSRTEAVALLVLHGGL